MRPASWQGVAAVLSLALAGCVRPPLAPPLAFTASPPDPTIERREATLGNGFIDVTVRLRRDLPGRRAVVITPIADEDWLLDAGVVLVTFRERWDRLPVPPAGPAAAPTAETYGKWLLASPSADSVGRGYFAFIRNSANQSIPQVLDYLVTLPEVDPRRLAISGHSTTGLVALQAVATQPRLKVVAVVNACGDYHAFLRDSGVALDGKVPLALATDYEAELALDEPIQHPERFRHARLLLVNGALDLAMPPSCVEPTVAAFRAAYGRRYRSRFRAVSLPEEGHTISDAARLAIRAWWQRWLLR